MLHQTLMTIAQSQVLPDGLRVQILRRLGYQVGAETLIWSGFRFHGEPEQIVIGSKVFINRGIDIDAGTASVCLEDGTVFGVGVVLAAGGHNISGPERRALGPNDAPVVIGAGSWLGARVVVLPGVHVAPGCVVGAGAVVTRDTEPNGVYVGVPARRVRDL
jgi:acetyltransferase-like isoleucine patch superfamily enzyme